ncbi:hypothetical protein Dimus_024034 [Dionaea muscipula]
MALTLRVLRRDLVVCYMGSLSKHQATYLDFLKARRSLSTSDASSSSVILQKSQQSQYGKLISIADLLQRYSCSPAEHHFFLDRSKFLLNSNMAEVGESMGNLSRSYKFPQDGLVSMICRCPGVLDFDFLKKWEQGILDLGPYGSSPAVFMSILEFSRKFEKEPREFSECIQVLKGLGFTACTISKVLEEFPWVVMIKELELEKRIGFLALYGLQGDETNRICSRFPGLLGFGVEDRLKPLLDEFSLLGFSEDLLRQEIVREPRILSMELGELALFLEFLETLRCRVPVKEKIFSKGKLKAGFAVKLRVDCLCKYGLTRRDALSVLKREPRIINYDISDTVNKIEFLLQRMKMNIHCLIEVPEYLGVNFNKQIVPRYNVIEYLRSVGGLGFDVRLRDLIKPSKLKFYNLYVKPYPECQKIFCTSSGDNDEAKSEHPTGLWKLFKPPKYPESKEDAKNIKSFMEPLF